MFYILLMMLIGSSQPDVGLGLLKEFLTPSVSEHNVS